MQAIDAIFTAFDAVDQFGEDMKAKLDPTLEQMSKVSDFLETARDVFSEFEEFTM